MNNKDIPPITSDIYIILSCYNEEETLEDVVTELVERGFKVIIVDDGSKDNSPKIARELVKKYNPYVYLYILNNGDYLCNLPIDCYNQVYLLIYCIYSVS